MEDLSQICQLKGGSQSIHNHDSMLKLVSYMLTVEIEEYLR